MSSSCGSKSNSSSCSSGTCGSQDAAIAKQDNAITTSLGKIKHKILVMSGKGGVGKSTVSTNLALGLAKKGYMVGLMDVDIHGPDICRMLNLNEKLHETQTAGGGLIPPMKFGENLKVISLEYMMEDRDDPIIWRGPLKVQAIRQFVADIDWGDLDYLIIDAPPGTGDEPLTVAQNIKDAQAIVVTTPQEISLADVRKSLNFCKHVKMKVVGMVENMSGFVCPHCSEAVDIFKSGGGEKTAKEFGVDFLGSVPIAPKVVIGGDDGNPYLSSDEDSPAVKAFASIVGNVEKNMSTAKVSLGNMDSDCACGPTCNPSKCAC
ncbi:MAG: Mrp/NBP35 family ATP-binding protein [Desulfobulbaceae bacterium]|uniref:Iron-sulfur cluster carrier protein n=1 Tax=Candidatus Desulfobia pelagia TaxID=2841692 RepID=A0A8J6TBB8_9BACT|nr:Mrp/NBP35 family ATP-binding protein [Candidatus Desulfobia pelagia]